MLNAMMATDALAERDEKGSLVSDLEWNGDTPHPKGNIKKLTCETLWLATSHHRDCHDNVNSEMFLNGCRTIQSQHSKRNALVRR